MNKGFTLIELIIVISIIMLIGTVFVDIFGGNIPNALVQNGTICEEGMKFSVSQGYRQQIIGPDGLPLSCN